MVYGGKHIVFGAKRSKQNGGCSGIVVYGGGNIVFGAKKVKAVDAVDAEEKQYMVVGKLLLV